MLRVLLLALALPAAFAWQPSGDALINDARYVAFLNSHNDSTWRAGNNPRFQGMTYNQARTLCGTALSHISEHLGEVRTDGFYETIPDEAIPATFDATTQWPSLVHPIRNQEQCGSCWAFSAAEVLSDRTSIAAGRVTPVLSPEDLVSCDKSDNGCGGGALPNAWNYLTQSGIVTDSCFPYSAGGGNAPACPNKCVDSESWTGTKQRAKTSYAINGVENMQKEIMTHGPIQVAFMVYKSFMSYTSGVYKKKWYEFVPEGGHAVKIVGWGTEDGTPYWLVSNSWGTSWGLNGFFKIERGTNQCGIEKTGPPYAGLPSL